MFKNKAEYLAFRNQLLAEAEQAMNAGNMELFNEKKAAIEAADTQFEALATAQANLAAMRQPINNFPADPATLDASPVGASDPYNTTEYRQAFMNFMKTGAMDKVLSNANATTTTSDVGAIVPTTIMREIIKKARDYGKIFARIRPLNVKGGVDFPILSLKPVATWIGETAVSDRQKVQANTKVSFNYYGVECRVATSLLADTVSLEGFESLVVDLCVEAIVTALEIAIFNGTGTGQPLGITKDSRVPAANIVTLSSTEINSYKSWKDKVFAKIPLAYRSGGTWHMAAGTFESKIDGMVDTAGQPIARVNAGIVDGPQERFNGREVLLVEDDIIKPYDTAATNDIIAVYCKLSDYAVNSNLQMTTYRWFDHDKNEWVDKVILIADGKLLDPNGVILIKKGA